MDGKAQALAAELTALLPTLAQSAPSRRVMPG